MPYAVSLKSTVEEIVIRKITQSTSHRLEWIPRNGYTGSLEIQRGYGVKSKESKQPNAHNGKSVSRTCRIQVHVSRSLICFHIAANTLEELKSFADSIAETKSRIEKQLYLSLAERIIPYIEDSIAVREKAERRKRTKERTMEIQFSNDPRTLRSSTRKPVRYRYDDMYDEQFEDDDYEGLEEDEVAPMKAGTRSSRRIAQRDTSPQRTRSSSRLRSDNNDSLEESPSERSFVGVEEVVETGQNVSSTIIPLEIEAE